MKLIAQLTEARDFLRKKRDAKTITGAEHATLGKLTTAVELLEAEEQAAKSAAEKAAKEAAEKTAAAQPAKA